MKYTLKQLKNMDVTKLYDMLLHVIIKLRKEYKFLELEDNKFKELIKEELLSIQKSNPEQILNISYVEEKIRIRLDNIVKLILNTSEFKILNNYINYLINSKEPIQELYLLKKISIFFDKYDYIPSRELLTKLLQNNRQLKNLLKKICQNNNLTNDEHINTIIEIFQEINAQFSQTETLNPENINIKDSLGIYYKSIKNYPILTKEEEYQLGIRIKKGDEEAKKRLIECNLKLVVKIAKYYLNRGLSLDDLIQEGNIGLMIAVDKFDASKGYKFSTYAVCWIKQSIIRAIETKGKTIRVTTTTYHRLEQLKKVKQNLEKKLFRIPTIEEIANEMELPIETIRELSKYGIYTISLNQITKDNKELENFIGTTENLEENLIKQDQYREIRDLLELCNLTKQEKEVIILRYGLDGDNPQNLKEIGKILQVTHQRIAQVEKSAIKKIRNSPKIDKLLIYMDFPKESLEFINTHRELSIEKITPQKIKSKI